MTNLQLWLSIGIPSVLIILSWLQQGTRISRLETSTDKGFEAVDRRFVEVERRFGEVERRFGEVERRFGDVERRFEEVERKFENFRGEMVALRDSIHRDMVTLHERVAVVETRQT